MCSKTDYLGMFPLDEGNTGLCLTREECVQKKMFVFESFESTENKCLTAS